MPYSVSQSVVDFKQDKTIIHGGRIVRGSVLAHLHHLAATDNLGWDVFNYDPLDIERLRAVAPMVLEATLTPGVASFSWSKCGLGVNPHNLALEWPEVCNDEIRDALGCSLPFERCCIEVSVTRDGVSHTVMWNLMEDENGWSGFFVHIYNGIAVVPGIGVFFDRTNLDDRGLPIYTYAVPPSFEKHYNILEIRKQMNMILRFLRILMHPEVQIEETRPSRLRRAMQKGKGRNAPEIQRIVYIDPVKLIGEKPPYLGGTHASPVEHVRRKHWRTLRSGVDVEVRECVVNRRNNNNPVPVTTPTYVLRDRTKAV